MQCRICGRQASEADYCKFHRRAYENIVKNYRAWNEALGLSWKEYLSEIAKNSVTGIWAKEVAECLARNGEKGDVKIS